MAMVIDHDGPAVVRNVAVHPAQHVEKRLGDKSEPAELHQPIQRRPHRFQQCRYPSGPTKTRKSSGPAGRRRPPPSPAKSPAAFSRRLRDVCSICRAAQRQVRGHRLARRRRRRQKRRGEIQILDPHRIERFPALRLAYWPAGSVAPEILGGDGRHAAGVAGKHQQSAPRRETP